MPLPRRFQKTVTPTSIIIFENEANRELTVLQSKDNLFHGDFRPDRHESGGRSQILPKIAATACSTMWALSLHSGPALAVQVAASSRMMPSRLGASNVVAAATMLVGLAALPLGLSFGASKIAKGLLLSASRCALQVFLLGAVILHKMIGVDRPLLVAAWIAGVGFIAGNEAFSRIQYTYPKMRRHVYSSVWAGAFIVLSLTLALRVLGTVEPWFQPRTWIPVAGMLFGNTLSATALGASTFTKDFVNQQDFVELRLARGATWQEAISPLVQDTLSTALTPTINGLAVTGIVHLPGMMTGQILAGQEVSQAALYQIMISFLIATTACITVQLLMKSAIGALLDSKSHRLRQGILSSKPEKSHQRKSMRQFWREIFQKKPERKHHEHNKDAVPAFLQTISPEPIVPVAQQKATTKSWGKSGAIILKTESLAVPRAMASVTLTLHDGDRIGITGQSGVGKSQVLRSIGGLEEPAGGKLTFEGKSLDDVDLPTFRTQVCLVPQRIPTIQGTPNMFYKEVRQFKRQQLKKSSDATFLEQSPEQIAQGWGVEERLFHQEWSTLSGGEAQRISLAIALSLRPKVLLLDESMSALDEATTKAIEATLIKSGIPIIMVTHSGSQLLRFCTSHMGLSPEDIRIELEQPSNKYRTPVGGLEMSSVRKSIVTTGKSLLQKLRGRQKSEKQAS